MRRRLLLLVTLLSLACSRFHFPDAAMERERERESQERELGVEESQDEPGEAAEYYASRREMEGDETPIRRYAAARERMAAMSRYATSDDKLVPARGDRGRGVASDAVISNKAIGSWTFLGPGNVGGRTRVLLIDPKNPDVMYAAAVSGGIWKTVNGGARWDATGDLLANLAVNSLVMDPADSSTLYAGTGEGYFREEQRGTGLPLRGNGIFVTHDGGASWSDLPSTATSDFHWVNDLVVSTHDTRRIYAATRNGVWRSDDAGATWTNALTTNVKGGCLDLAWRGDTAGDYLFASCGTFERATVYRNEHAENDGTWTSVLSEANMGRTTLAIAPSDPAVIYALSASNEPGVTTYQGMLAVFRSEKNGDPASWTAVVRNTDADKLARLLLTNPAPATGSICTKDGVDNWTTMGWYCNTIAVDPADSNRVWAAGVDLFRSDDGGRSWGLGSAWWVKSDDPRFVHADQHAIVFDPRYNGTSNRKVFVANDGGVFRSDDARATVAKGPAAACNPNTGMRWHNLNNNYGATQFYHGDAFPDGLRYLGGAQDNGTIIGDVRKGLNQWQRVAGGDGGYVAIDRVDPSIVYAESQNGRLFKSTDGALTFEPFPFPNDSFIFITPFLLDPNAHQRIWIGGRSMWRSDAGDGKWAQAGPQFAGRVSAIAVAPGRSELVLAGTNSGEIMRTTEALTATATSNWKNTAPRGGFVSSLTFDPVDSNVAYATFAGFGGTHLWKSIDAGLTWSPLDGSGAGALPDIPVHSIAIDPTRRERLYLGTDLGIFTSSDGGNQWMVENSGFQAVVTETVFIGRGAYGPAVYAFTHGRGAWRAELTAPSRRRAAGR